MVKASSKDIFDVAEVPDGIKLIRPGVDGLSATKYMRTFWQKLNAEVFMSIKSRLAFSM